MGRHGRRLRLAGTSHRLQLKPVPAALLAGSLEGGRALAFLLRFVVPKVEPTWAPCERLVVARVSTLPPCSGGNQATE